MRFRGLGGMTPATASVAAEVRLERLLARATSASEPAPWVWFIRLENSAH